MLLTTREVAARLRLNVEVVRRKLRRGEIPGAVKVGRLWRISDTSLAEHIK
jgi:excisionase family DNA binding protein